MITSLTTEDLAVLGQQDMDTLAEWWYVLNHWGWPDEFPDPPALREFGDRGSSAMRWIENAIGFRQCLYHANVKRPQEGPLKQMTEEVFNDFWRGCFEGVPHAKERYYKWLHDLVRNEQELPNEP